MSLPPPAEQQVSPDGAWRWDGQRWVPTNAPAPSGAPRRGSGRWVWWVAGGCLVLLVLGIAGGVWGATALVHRFEAGGLSCLPSDFPRYSGATVTRDFTTVGTNVAPGDSHECQEFLSSSDDVGTVTAYYRSHLEAGDWTITDDAAANGEIKFARKSRPETVGVVDLLGRGQHTDIEIRVDS